jgi:hypothetical protein
VGFHITETLKVQDDKVLIESSCSGVFHLSDLKMQHLFQCCITLFKTMHARYILKRDFMVFDIYVAHIQKEIKIDSMLLI